MIPVTDEEILLAVKTGMGIQPETTAMDTAIEQKIKMVKMFMQDGGVPEDNLYSDLAVGVITMGVGDIWFGAPGEAKLSTAFWTMAKQLAIGNTDE